jgi:pimeloyl-ACP methyl ester carboxylesterase
MDVDHIVTKRTIVAGPAGPLEVHVSGRGPSVVLLASLGRGAGDFTDLAARLAAAGFCALAPEPRGVGASSSPLDGVTLADLADDVAAVLRTLAGERATVVGHAFGNRLARMVATRHRDAVESVVLLACGGLVPPAPEVTAAMTSIFDASLDSEARLSAVARAFFAPGHDPSPWEGGWHAGTAAAQAAATAATPVGDWWTAGSADVLVLQPAADVVAVPENATRLVEVLGRRAHMVTIPDAGHALLPEQPAAVATEVLAWLHRRRLESAAPA